MGGLSLTRDGALSRYNAAYRAVPARQGGARGAKVTIPIPLGLIQFFKDHPIGQLGDDPTFNPDSAAFNPIELMNLVFNPPIFYEVKAAPAPTNDVEFTIGKNAFIVDLGATQRLIPSDEFGLGGSSRLLDLGLGFAGFKVGVTGWLHYDVGMTLGDTLRRFLKEADPARTRTTYYAVGDGLLQGGWAPTLSYVGRLVRTPGDSAGGLYLGAAVRYYVGSGYARGIADTAGFITGDTIFGANPVTPVLSARGYTTNNTGLAAGHGVGGDIGLVWVSGPIEVGLGVNDIGAELTWSDTRIQRVVYDTATDDFVSTPVADNVESKTKLPVSYIANIAMQMGTGTVVGADILDNGRGTVIHVGGEQRVGLLTVRGGVARDQRKKMQFGWGGGVRLGAVGLDVGFWTHSNSFSDARAITMATSLSIY
jgi:hypothetical protein